MIRNYVLFIFLSCIDLYLTKLLVVDCPNNFYELNVFAEFFLVKFGFLGLCFFKFLLTMFVVGISVYVLYSKHRPSWIISFGRAWLIPTANVLLSAVCLYELFLYSFYF
jgi:hypothetical protein